MHRFPRKLDKENNLETQYKTAKTSPAGKAPLTPSNNQLRKKMDESLAAFERSNGSGKQRQEATSTSRCKRQRAKNQQFNRKVNSIASINQKITSLLDMVRKDKVGRINTTVVQTQQSDSPIVALKQVRKQFPLVSPFIKNKVDVSKQDDYKFKESITSDPTTRIVLNSQHESLKEMSIKQLRKKYLPEPSSNNIHNKSQKPHNSFSIQQDSSGAKGKGTDYLSRILERGESEDSFVTEKRNIDEILQDRKVKREKGRQERREQFSKQIIPQQSYFKSQFNQSQKTQNQSSFKFETSFYEDDKDYKTNSTTRLIDEQIKRIKSKIGNNQSFTQKSQVKQTDVLSNESINRKFNHTKSQEQHTSSIAMKLSIQVDYDNQLRPARMAFDKISGEQKWDNLQKQLQRKGMKISIQYIKELMRVTADQHNPFSEDKSENTKDIVQLFISAQKNWENEVSACITVQEMKAVNFNPAQIDLTRKGCLSVEDIVCFVNLNTGSFYRNRDLALVFRRFQLGTGETGSTITYKAFQQTFTK